MTTVTIKKKHDHICEVLLMGHAGGGAYGEDLVCAALSAISQTAVLGLNEVAKIKATFSRDNLKGLLWIALPDNLTKQQQHDADMILGTMMCGIYDIQKGYPKLIKTEVTACL